MEIHTGLPLYGQLILNWLVKVSIFTHANCNFPVKVGASTLSELVEAAFRPFPAFLPQSDNLFTALFFEECGFGKPIPRKIVCKPCIISGIRRI